MPMPGQFEVMIERNFSSAHQLRGYRGKCENLHGHTFRLTVTVENAVQKDGMAFDFLLLKNVVREKIIARLDHTYLNDLMPNPSAENLAIWIWDELSAALPVKPSAAGASCSRSVSSTGAGSFAGSSAGSSAGPSAGPSTNSRSALTA